MAIAIIAVVWIIVPQRICKRSTEEKPVIAKLIAVEPTPVEPTPVEPAKSGMEAAGMEAPKSAAVEAPKSAAVETSASAMWPGVGAIRRAECGSANQNGCDCQNPYPGPGSGFA